MADGKKQPGGFKERLTLWFGHTEDAIYVGLGLLLSAIALSLLVTEMVYFVNYLFLRTLTDNVVFLLDRILLIIIFVEVLYTVQVSFRQHVLQPEPFLVVGLIAVTRRILVLTAEMSKLAKEAPEGLLQCDDRARPADGADSRARAVFAHPAPPGTISRRAFLKRGPVKTARRTGK